MATGTRDTDKIRVIKECIGRRFHDVSAYRYNLASVRIRVIDPAFQGQSKAERNEAIRPLLTELPEETRRDISVLLLLAPDEVRGSLMNAEFEDPTPSML